MKVAMVVKTVNLGYKSGYVECVCGWRKELGDGFNGHHIANCPKCTPELETRNQRKVTTGRPGNLHVTIGRHIYFVLSNGLHMQFSRCIYREHFGLSQHRADAL